MWDRWYQNNSAPHLPPGLTQMRTYRALYIYDCVIVTHLRGLSFHLSIILLMFSITGLLKTFLSEAEIMSLIHKTIIQRNDVTLQLYICF